MPPDADNRLKISATQTVAGAMAAVTSAVIGSRLGIAGTILGAGAGSIVATTGSAVYGHWIGRTAYRVRTVVLPPGTAEPAADPTAGELIAVPPAAAVHDPAHPALARRADRRRGQSFGFFLLGATAMFGAALGAITGHPLSYLTGANEASGTTVGRAISEAEPPAVVAPLTVPTTETPEPTPSETPSSTPEVTTPTPDPTMTTTDPGTETPPATSPPSSSETPPIGR